MEIKGLCPILNYESRIFLKKTRKITITPNPDNCFLDRDWTRVLQEWNQQVNNRTYLFVE